MKLTEACIKKPVFAWMLMAATMVFGGVAATRIGISQFPDVDFPNISIQVAYEGAAPEVLEHDVVEPIEEAVVQVEGVKSITSTARQGGATITVELNLSRDVDLALQDVQTRVAQAKLPVDIRPPQISKTNPEDQPIMWVGLSGPFSPQLLTDTARYRVKERLQTIDGVGEVMMGGYLERNVRVWLNADWMDEKQVTVTEVLDALKREHVEQPAGQIVTPGREINVRVLGEALDLAAMSNLIIKKVNGSPVHLSDVAYVQDGFEDERRRARVNGVPVQGMGIKKQRGSNAVAVAKGVKAALDDIRSGLPEDMKLDVMFDGTRFIEESVHEIEWALLLAVALTALVCWMFLGSISSTLNVILAIPMSLLGTIAVIYFLGFTLNTFTLLGLSLAVGIVVDDAIMVMENIFRHAEGGKDRVAAARDGTNEITFAALAATLAVVAIFLPVIFMKGVIGKFFLQFGVTLCVAVLLSYLEAITLAPARCSQLLRAGKQDRTWLGRIVDRAFDALGRGYGWVLRHALRWPVAVLVLGGLLFYLSIGAFKKLPGEFVPSQDQSRLMVRLQTATGADMGETDTRFQLAEAYLATRPEVKRYFAVIGSFGGGQGSGVNSGILMVTLVPPDQRNVTQAQFAAVLRKELNSYAGVRAVVQDLSQAGFTAQRGFPVEFSVRGSDWPELITQSERLMDELRASGLVVDLDTDYKLGTPELSVVPDRPQASDLGVSISDVARTVNALVGGMPVARYSQGGRREDVRVRLVASQRSRPEDLSRLQVRSQTTGKPVPLSMLVHKDERPTLQAITRQNRERAIGIFGNVAPGHSQSEALAYVEQLARDLPVGTHAVLGGASVAFKESMGGLGFALLLGIVVAYMVLASQFNSFLHPITVLTILPLSIAGAGFALLWTGHSLNIFSAIGILLLMGIVKKNSIILVDYATQLRGSVADGGRGLDARAAMLAAGPVRLRPILMTSVATLMAALPAALSVGAGTEVRAPMAIAVIGGLIVSTVLSLLVVPAFYVMADSTKRWLVHLLRLDRDKDKPIAAAPPGHTP